MQAFDFQLAFSTGSSVRNFFFFFFSMNQDFSNNNVNNTRPNNVMNGAAAFAANGAANIVRNSQAVKQGMAPSSMSRGFRAEPARSRNGSDQTSQGVRISRTTTNKNKAGNTKANSAPQSRRRKVLSVSQLLLRVQKQRQLTQKKRQKPIKPIIPPKSLIIILKDKPEKAVYNRRIIDYKHCGLLQRYIGLGGKILPRRQTKLTAKQQRYIAKTIKTARIMGLLPFVTKERGFFR